MTKPQNRRHKQPDTSCYACQSTLIKYTKETANPQALGYNYTSTRFQVSVQGFPNRDRSRVRFEVLLDRTRKGLQSLLKFRSRLLQTRHRAKFERARFTCVHNNQMKMYLFADFWSGRRCPLFGLPVSITTGQISMGTNWSPKISSIQRGVYINGVHNNEIRVYDTLVDVESKNHGVLLGSDKKCHTNSPMRLIRSIEHNFVMECGEY